MGWDLIPSGVQSTEGCHSPWLSVGTRELVLKEVPQPQGRAGRGHPEEGPSRLPDVHGADSAPGGSWVWSWIEHA